MAFRLVRDEESMIVDGNPLFDFHLRIVGECARNPDGDGMSVLSKAGRRYITEIVALHADFERKSVLFIDFST